MCGLSGFRVDLNFWVFVVSVGVRVGKDFEIREGLGIGTGLIMKPRK